MSGNGPENADGRRGNSPENADGRRGNGQKGGSLIKRNDLRLIAGLVLFVLILFAVRSFLFRGSGARVIVSQNGSVIREYPLDGFTDQVITNPENGGENHLHISGGKVWVSDASCPDKICEHYGKISGDGEVIVCLPNRLIIQVAE